MKTKFFIFSSFLFSLFLIFSCESKRTEDGDYLFGLNKEPIIYDPVTIKVLKNVSIQYNNGKSSTMDFSYANKQLVGVTYDRGAMGKTQFVFTYNGANPDKAIITEDDGTSQTVTSLDLVYSSGRLSTANGTTIDPILGNMTVANVFTYASNGKLSKVVTNNKSSIPLLPGMIVTSDLSYTGNNISTWKLNIDMGSISNSTTDTSFTNFDDKKSPFATLPSFFRALTLNYSSGIESPWGLSSNNFLKATSKTLNVSKDVTSSFLYDTDGYPVTGTSSEGKMIFGYIIP